jgi:hypothetical protein
MRTRVKLSASLGVLLCIPAVALAGDLRVPSQYKTIGAASDAAREGDRIVVTGGVHEYVTLKRRGVSIVGRGGAKIVGTAYVTGDRVTVSGFAFKEALLYVSGEDASIVGNRFSGPGVYVDATALRARVQGNRFSSGRIDVDGPDAVVRGNHLRGAPLSTGGRGARIEDNRLSGRQLIYARGADVVIRGNVAREVAAEAADGAVVESNKTTSLLVLGDGVTVRDNTVSGWGFGVSTPGLQVAGDDAAVVGNDVRDSSNGIEVTGANAKILENEVEVSSRDTSTRDCPSMGTQPNSSFGIQWNSDRPVTAVGEAPVRARPGGKVERNRVNHARARGVSVVAVGASVRGNVLHGATSSTSISITGSSNEIVENHVAQSGGAGNGGAGIDVLGDANVIRENRVDGVASDGILVAGGVGNVVENDVLSGNRGSGIFICGPASGTIVDGCEVRGSALGVVNLGGATSLVDTTAKGNGPADLLDVGGLSLDEGNALGRLSRDALLVPPGR